MKIYTLNVGQGQFVVVTGDTEAIVIDTCISISPAEPIINVKGALTDILSGKNLVGLMITGFDADHFNEIGVSIVLNKYRPDWIMYPKYFKETKAASAGFSVINKFEAAKNVKRISVALGDNTKRFYFELSKDFSFEIFSPHKEDMDSSNNSSLVCRIKERSTGATYLVTGDTEDGRWDNIAKIFGTSLKSDVLDASHHGSKNGMSRAALNYIRPHTVLISAGVDNSYGHPHNEAIAMYRAVATNVWATNGSASGQSLLTTITRDGIRSTTYG